jgi:2-C-methyl-D-erythritol 2,4-cyclodiphosphate synthase
MKLRIGQGYDLHRLVAGRSFVVGGVGIPHSHGPLGHSDGDVVLHAICDALLGALALGDIGAHFPDTDPQWAGADSSALTAHVVGLVKARGYRVVNVDVTVHAELPKIGPHGARIRSHVAGLLDCDVDAVSIKAKTNEGLGEIGRGEAIAATAIALLAATT